MNAPRARTREIRRPQLSEEVAGRLRAAIMTGDLRPGEYIRMDETAAQLGVSVTPVREALLTLRGEGMVDAVPHRGYAVAALSRKDVEDIFALQSHLAVELAKAAAARITPEQADALAELNDALRNATSPIRSSGPSSNSTVFSTMWPTARSWPGSSYRPCGIHRINCSPKTLPGSCRRRRHTTS